MLQRRLYYCIKPYIPWVVRNHIRGLMQRRARKRLGSSWPISQTAGMIPPSWPGWPDNKRFCLVITHDVEGRQGFNHVRSLAATDMKFGFRSAFNFVPEGEYEVDIEIRKWLRINGFEVGVHDLHHDGKLLSSEHSFRQGAKHINHYLKEWEATGFRAAFMHHNLEWFRQLAIRYDCSTFDTDPFEPQPDGVNTIFPFWVQPKVGIPSNQESVISGYYELPYTLPQDSTLFQVFREQGPEVWNTKLDWIASQGGMALVNVHPDYIAFDGKPASAKQYPVAYYEQFLAYVQKRYAGEYWAALPCEVVAHMEAHRYSYEPPFVNA